MTSEEYDKLTDEEKINKILVVLVFDPNEYCGVILNEFVDEPTPR